MSTHQFNVWLPAIRTGTGSEVFTQRLAGSLEKYGVRTQITWYGRGWEPLAPLLRHTDVPQGTDIIFANSWNGFAFRRTGIPLVVTLHHGGFALGVKHHRTVIQNMYRRFLIERFELSSFGLADAITAVSQYAANSLRPLLAPEKDIEVIPNWVNTDLFAPANAPVRHQSPFRLLFVGKLSRIKGADILSPLMRQLGPQFELYVAGKISSELQDKLPANIRLLGWLDQPALIRAYQECDALICPSHSEGFSYATVEAMACGKPVIASNVTALPELIIDGVNGILCRSGCVTEFAEAANFLLRDPEKCLNYGRAAREKAMEFSEANAVRKYLDLITALCGSR